MQTDTHFDRVRAQLFPDLDALTPQASSSWRRHIHNPALRASLMENPRLQEHILSEVLRSTDGPHQPYA